MPYTCSCAYSDQHKVCKLYTGDKLCMNTAFSHSVVQPPSWKVHVALVTYLQISKNLLISRNVNNVNVTRKSLKIFRFAPWSKLLLPRSNLTFLSAQKTEKDSVKQITSSGTSGVSHVSVRQKILWSLTSHWNDLTYFPEMGYWAEVDGGPGLSAFAKHISPNVSFFVSLEMLLLWHALIISADHSGEM